MGNEEAFGWSNRPPGRWSVEIENHLGLRRVRRHYSERPRWLRHRLGVGACKFELFGDVDIQFWVDAISTIPGCSHDPCPTQIEFPRPVHLALDLAGVRFPPKLFKLMVPAQPWALIELRNVLLQSISRRSNSLRSIWVERLSTQSSGYLAPISAPHARDAQALDVG